ncbi:rhomboid family intramembrane serine protease [Shewanella baltica]|uniref:rhomboid family intramembrane serine protease n=1 Tax=Shewanella baltica TaxID=62322 RepID=UPI00217F033E|nr:rhomboid family intramembrane serine protease [Shewanella baltica]MCS6257679.1 rhomboid family intramembrane serine protease [Shewanella baltica]
MDVLLKKLQLIYFPFLFTSLLFISGYSLIHWLLLIKFEFFSIDEDLVNFGLPLILSWLLLLVFLRPRLKLLKFVKDNSRFFYLLFAVQLVAVPCIIAQEYLKTATGQLTQLASIQELYLHKKTQYYQLQQAYIDKTQIGVQRNIEVTGKSNSHLNMTLYIAMPIFASGADRRRTSVLAWYGKTYQQEISNRLETDEKEQAYKAFLTQSQHEFDKFDPQTFVYLERLAPSSLKRDLLSAAEKSPLYQAEYPTIFMPKFEPFEARNGNKLAWMLIWFVAGALVWFVLLLRVKLDEEALKAETVTKRLNHAGTIVELNDFFEMIRPKPGFIATPILMYLNVLVFILMAWSSQHFINLQGSFMLEWGANFRPKVLAGEWWRLITSTFIHGGLAHLALNLYGLFFVGSFLEPVLGKWRLFLAYLITGILASIASICWYDATVSVGASGAIMGLLGILVIWAWKKIFPEDINWVLSINLAFFVTISLVAGLLGGVDNAAHIGGLLSGLVLGYLSLRYARGAQGARGAQRARKIEGHSPAKKRKPRRK